MKKISQSLTENSKNENKYSLLKVNHLKDENILVINSEKKGLREFYFNLNNQCS